MRIGTCLAFLAGVIASQASAECVDGAQCGIEAAVEGDDAVFLQKQTSSRWRRYTVLKPDSRYLTWDTEPIPGQKVTGKLTVPLDYDDPESPRVQLSVAMQPAEIQPSLNGPYLYHPGGPGSDSTMCCQTDWLPAGGYDVWMISQRGIGPDANPSLLCNDSHLPEVIPGKSYKISDFTDCPCAMPDGTPMMGETWAGIDPMDDMEVRNMFAKIAQRSNPCYNSKKFQLLGSNGKQYNFLEYLGTQLLAYDIEMMRMAIGAETMTIHGKSYGTYVGGVYATAFPQHMHRMVLDGNVPPMPQKEDLATGGGMALQKSIDKLLQACAQQQDQCSFKNPEAGFPELINAARNKQLFAENSQGKFYLPVGMLIGALEPMLHDNSGTGWADATLTLAKLSSPNQTERSAMVGEILDKYCHVKGVSTWRIYNVCVGPGQTAEKEGVSGDDPFIDQTAVLSADLAGIYSVESAMALWRATALKYADTGVTGFLGWFAATFTWPAVPTPFAPIGNAEVSGIVVGNLYDPSTWYHWSQMMAQSFPRASMITWQGVGHCTPHVPESANFTEADEPCAQRVKVYFESGHLPVNGYVCRLAEPIPVA